MNDTTIINRAITILRNVRDRRVKANDLDRVAQYITEGIPALTKALHAANEHDRALATEMPFCEQCNSWHVTPKDRDHWLALKCRKPIDQSFLPVNLRGVFRGAECHGLFRKSQFIATGEFRAPKKGEWFLSGAIVEAYECYVDAIDNERNRYWIAQLVQQAPLPKRFDTARP